MPVPPFLPIKSGLSFGKAVCAVLRFALEEENKQRNLGLGSRPLFLTKETPHKAEKANMRKNISDPTQTRQAVTETKTNRIKKRNFQVLFVEKIENDFKPEQLVLFVSKAFS